MTDTPQPDPLDQIPVDVYLPILQQQVADSMQETAQLRQQLGLAQAQIQALKALVRTLQEQAAAAGEDGPAPAAEPDPLAPGRAQRRQTARR